MKPGEDKGASHVQGLAGLVSTDAMDKLRTRAEADPVFLRILGELVRNAGNAPWREIHDGVSVRPIWDDRTFLLRCAAGKQVPSHFHPREEWLCVLDGEMRTGESRFPTGHIEIYPAGSQHPAAEAFEDCLVLLQYSC